MKVSIDELKEIQLEILKSVHSFCEKYRIKYYLTYGTLIGAIRHKGYIPWDDDVDICMSRPEYEKFMKMFNEKQDRYRFISYEIDKTFPYTFGKIIDPNTKLIEDSVVKYPLGINIDIFPIDGIDNGVINLKRQIFLRNLINIKTITYSKKRSMLKNSILIIGKILLFPIPLRFFIRYMVKNAKLHSYMESKLVTCLVMGTKLNKPVPKEYFGEGKLALFENQRFYVPSQYDQYLSSIYGNYMELPPEDKRVTHHVFEAYILRGEK